MADEGAADDLAGDIGGDEVPAKKSGGLKGALPVLLKYILIGIAAVIFIVTIVIITNLIMNRGGKSQTKVPVGVEYTTQREVLSWYTTLDQIRTQTCDDINPANVVVQVVLGYKKDDKNASTEITERRIEIVDFLRQFFSSKSEAEIAPDKEEGLKNDIRDQINENILSRSKIRDVRFTTKDVVKAQ